MSQKQPEALRLADELENSSVYEASGLVVWGWAVGHESNPTDDAADELRRLHAVNAELTALLKEAVPHLTAIARMPNAEWVADAHNKAADALRQALAKAEGCEA